MKKKSKDSHLSRRSFLKNVGTGVVGSYVIPPLLKANAKKLPKEIKDSLKGKVKIKLVVNGVEISRNVKPSATLAEFIRNDLELTGTKVVCNQGECGGCTVLVNGKPVYSCHFLALDADGSEVTTIEGLLDGETLHPIQKAFVDKDGLQCGFCTPGQIMSAYGLLLHNPKPQKKEILEALSGNLCRCGAYPKIVDSVLEASSKL